MDGCLVGVFIHREDCLDPSTESVPTPDVHPPNSKWYATQCHTFEKLTRFQLVKKFPAFYGTRRFVTTFTSARHLSLSWASSIQVIPPHPTSWRSILILTSHLCLGLPSGLFLSISFYKQAFHNNFFLWKNLPRISLSKVCEIYDDIFVKISKISGRGSGNISVPYATIMLTYLLTPWSRVLLEKLTGSQLVKKFPAFYGSRGLLPHLQVPSTCPYPEPAQSSLCPHIPFPEDPL